MNDITTLRAHLFDTLAALKDKENPMEIERARAVSEIAQTIINSAKIEVDYARVTGTAAGKFLGIEQTDEQPAQGATRTGSLTRSGNVVTHKLRG